jgi:hypothetical protein
MIYTYARAHGTRAYVVNQIACTQLHPSRSNTGAQTVETCTLLERYSLFARARRRERRNSGVGRSSGREFKNSDSAQPEHVAIQDMGVSHGRRGRC